MDLKQAYQEKARAQLCEWQAWIERFKADPQMDGRQEHHRQMARLDDRMQLALHHLEELCGSSDVRWELAKQALERAMIDVKTALVDSGAMRAGRFLQIEASRAHAYEPFQRRG